MTESDAPAAAPSMFVQFWGVRGSVTCPGPSTVRYGGNTPCVEVRCGENILILDAGTGIRALGNALLAASVQTELNIFLSHCHIDHVIGLPFFAPIFEPGRVLRIWAGHLNPEKGIECAIRRLMAAPLFPLHIEDLKARIEFRDFCAGEVLKPFPSVILRTAHLNHPDGATGYRIEYSGRSLVYLTDIEIGFDPTDPQLLTLAQGADLVILDATYTDSELTSHAGWGHSSWQQGIRFANAAQVGQLCLFHHDPDHDDDFMDAVAEAANAARPGTIVAREGLRVML